ncbi:Diacylglycerol kinase [Entamoeba marina]
MSLPNLPQNEIGMTTEDFKKCNLFPQDHDYKEYFSLSTRCDACGQLTIGPAYKCNDCGVVIHKQCAQTCFIPCKKPLEPKSPRPTFSKQNLQSGQHYFKKVNKSMQKYCFVCHEQIQINRVKCMICGVNCHKKCVKSVKRPCRPITAPPDTEDVHWFVPKQQLRFTTTCAVCETTCKSFHYECAWCKLDVDNACLSLLPKKCSRGFFGKHVIPPRLVKEDGDWFKAEAEDGIEPYIFFINNKSGNHYGSDIFKSAVSLFNPAQVYNVLKGYERPMSFIENYKDNFVAIICGGDGTVGWVMDELRKAGKKPKIFVIPLGTGNDMSISTGWGGGYNGQSIKSVLKDIDYASIQNMDRWKICVDENEEPIHLAYFLLSAPALVNDTKLYKALTLQVDGRMVDLPRLEGLAIINLPTYGGGNKFWKAVSLREIVYGYHNLNYGDSEIEVVGFYTAIHMAGCEKVVVLTLIDEMACQYDGEPYIQQKCTLTISLHDKVRFLVNNSFNN